MLIMDHSESIDYYEDPEQMFVHPKQHFFNTKSMFVNIKTMFSDPETMFVDPTHSFFLTGNKYLSIQIIVFNPKSTR